MMHARFALFVAANYRITVTGKPLMCPDGEEELVAARELVS